MMKPILHFANLVHDEQDNDLEQATLEKATTLI